MAKQRMQRSVLSEHLKLTQRSRENGHVRINEFEKQNLYRATLSQTSQPILANITICDVNSTLDPIHQRNFQVICKSPNALCKIDVLFVLV
jgi:hypothetical protein